MTLELRMIEFEEVSVGKSGELGFQQGFVAGE